MKRIWAVVVILSVLVILPAMPAIAAELDPAELKYQISFSESLIDYKARTNRCGIGVLLTDWL